MRIRFIRIINAKVWLLLIFKVTGIFLVKIEVVNSMEINFNHTIIVWESPPKKKKEEEENGTKKTYNL